jgi:hypothetical protein
MIVLVSVILMDLLAGMEFDLFVPSFPQLQNQFNLTPFSTLSPAGWILLSGNIFKHRHYYFSLHSHGDHYFIFSG